MQPAQKCGERGAGENSSMACGARPGLPGSGARGFPSNLPRPGWRGPGVFKSAGKPLLTGGGFWEAPRSLGQYLPQPVSLAHGRSGTGVGAEGSSGRIGPAAGSGALTVGAVEAGRTAGGPSLMSEGGVHQWPRAEFRGVCRGGESWHTARPRFSQLCPASGPSLLGWAHTNLLL